MPLEQAGLCVGLTKEKSTDGCWVWPHWAWRGHHRGLLVGHWYLKESQLPKTARKMASLGLGSDGRLGDKQEAK